MNELILNPVFIDTSIFYKYNFNFESTQFKELVELSNEKMIKVVLTEIVEAEILKNIETLSQSVEDSYKNFCKRNYLLKFAFDHPIEMIDLENKINRNRISEKCKADYQKWKDAVKVELLPISYANSSEVFKDYFSQSPPFHLKKKEFPDGFNLSIICSKFQKILLVSADKDILDIKNPKIINTFTSLNTLIDFLLKQRYSKYDLIVKEFNKQKEFILNQIREGFPTFKFISMYGSYVEEPTVKDLYINREDIIKIEKTLAIINLNLFIKYEIPVFYEKDDDYKIESDYHEMDIEIRIDYDYDQKTNSIKNAKTSKISPKNWEESIVIIHEEEFPR